MRVTDISKLDYIQIISVMVVYLNGQESVASDLLAMGMAVAEQGKWPSMWLISDEDDGFYNWKMTLEYQFLTASLDCSSNLTVLNEITGRKFTKLRGDFVNIMIYCPGWDFTNSLTEFYHASPEKRVYFNWLLMGLDNTTVIPFHLFSEGDNVAGIKKTIGETEVRLYDIWRCITNCYDPGSFKPYLEELSRPNDVFAANIESILPAEFKGFAGRTLDVTYKGSSTSVYVKETKLENGDKLKTGVEMEILNTLAPLMNFSYKMSGPPGGSYGVYDSDSRQWTGMIGVLERGDAEFALGGIAVTHQRLGVVDFIYPYKYVENSIFFRTNPDAARAEYFFETFTSDVWLCLLVIPLALGLCVWLCLKMLDERAIVDVIGVFLDVYVVLLRQSMGKSFLSRYLTMRFILSCYLFGMLAATAVYMGNLIAVLTVPIVKMPFSSIEELAANDDFALTVSPDSATQFLRESKDPKMALLWQKVQKDPTRSYVKRRRTSFLTLPPGSKVASFDSISGMERYQKIYDVCSVGKLKGTYFPRGVGIAVRKRTPYLKYLDKLMLRMLEAGLFEKWNKMYQPKDPCVKKKAKGQESIALRDIYIVFLLLCSGISLGFLVLLGELITKHFTKRRLMF